MSGPRLNRSQYARLRRLLNMMYKPSELADELGISVDAIYRSFIPAGAPVKMESATGRIWINGAAFSAWVHEYLTARRKNKPVLKENQAYCTRCNKIIEAGAVKLSHYRAGVDMLSGRCPDCNAKVNRFIRIEKQGADE